MCATGSDFFSSCAAMMGDPEGLPDVDQGLFGYGDGQSEHGVLFGRQLAPVVSCQVSLLIVAYYRNGVLFF